MGLRLHDERFGKTKILELGPGTPKKTAVVDISTVLFVEVEGSDKASKRTCHLKRAVLCIALILASLLCCGLVVWKESLLIMATTFDVSELAVQEVCSAMPATDSTQSEVGLVFDQYMSFMACVDVVNT